MTVSKHMDEGLYLAARGQYLEAALSFCQAVKLAPHLAEAYQRLGEVLIPLARWDDAQASFLKAIELQPIYPEAYNHLGVVFKNKELLAEAEECFHQAISQQDDYAAAYHNLGNCLKLTRRYAEAEAAYLRAMDLAPDRAETRFSLSTLYLIQDQYEKGWPLHEARIGQQGKFRLPIAPWRGEDLTGRRILLYHEQGFGDMLHFIRYAPRVTAAAKATTVWLQRPLARLFAETQTAFAVCTDGRTLDPAAFDFACSLYSLPTIFKTTADTIPRTVPYIKAPAALAAKWRDKIAVPADGKFKIGVVWAGNPGHDDDSNRSIPFKTFRRLFAGGPIFWASLQVGGQERSRAVRQQLLYVCDDELVDFAETAGLIANLDLVITVDTSVAHLAGAMGKATWVLLPYRPDWRWGLERVDSPWYPTMRLFRQSRLGDWPEVLGRVKGELHAIVREKKTT